MADDECGAVGGVRIGKGKGSTRRKLALVTLSTRNPTLPDLDSMPDRRGGKLATNRLIHGTVYSNISNGDVSCPEFTFMIESRC
jgi:hypothetical protein